MPGLGRSSGVENGNPFQYFCQENSMDRGSWWFTIHGVTKEPDKIEYAYTHTHTHTLCFRPGQKSLLNLINLPWAPLLRQCLPLPGRPLLFPPHHKDILTSFSMVMSWLHACLLTLFSFIREAVSQNPACDELTLEVLWFIKFASLGRLHFHFSLSCIGEGNGNPLQCSCLENPRDRGAWWAAVYGVALLKWLSSSSSRKTVGGSPSPLS